MIRRRALLMSITLALLAVALTAEAQSAGKATARIGYIGNSDPKTFAPELEAFRQGLGDLGWIEGQNVSILLIDPVDAGFVASLARPGGNITGLASQYEEIVTKQVELLAEAVPNLSRMVLLRHASMGKVTDRAAVAAADKRGLKAEVETGSARGWQCREDGKIFGARLDRHTRAREFDEVGSTPCPLPFGR
jgi:hypothetical protein